MVELRIKIPANSDARHIAATMGERVGEGAETWRFDKLPN